MLVVLLDDAELKKAIVFDLFTSFFEQLLSYWNTFRLLQKQVKSLLKASVCADYTTKVC